MDKGAAQKPGRPERVSKRLEPKTASQFGRLSFKTSFSAVYTKGGLPCRLEHGSVRHKVRWTSAPDALATYDPLLLTALDGLRETEHPYAFLAHHAVLELLAADGAFDKVLPLLPRAAAPLRAGLTARETPVVHNTLQVLQALAALVGPYAVDTLLSPGAGLLGPMASKLFQREHRAAIEATLQAFEEHGGPAAHKAIKVKVPTWTSTTFAG